MKRISIVAAFLLAGFIAVSPASPPPAKGSALKNAVVLIIRHAEKPDTGFELSPAGQKRAEAYVDYFKNYSVDGTPLKLSYVAATADSKNSHRPRLTVEPLGKALGLNVDTRFKNKNFQGLVDELLSRDHGSRILICWHHGEIPALARALGADPGKLLPEGRWPDQEFASLIELHFDAEGRLLPESTRWIKEGLMPDDPKP